MERQVKLKVDAGDEQVELIRVEAAEALSQHFHLAIDVLAPLGEIDWLPHLGKPAAVTVYEDDELQRYFHGVVVDCAFIREITGIGKDADDAGGWVYRLTLRPKAFLHEQGKSFRIFQNKTVKDILQNMFERCGIDVDYDRLDGGTRMRSYCVQYGESDFGFISRLMEEEGIYYYYEHSREKHDLVLCSSPSAHAQVAMAMTYNPVASAVAIVDSAARSAGAHKQFITSWHERVSTGGEAKVTMRDFDFIQPHQPLEVASDAERAHPEDAVEVYAYPGRFYKKNDGTDLSQVVLEARRANRRTFSGESRVGSIACGLMFHLVDHPFARFNDKYLITHVHHSIASELYRSGVEQDGAHLVSFEAIPGNVQWRAPLTTRRPVVAGPETAIVTGPDGEQIHTDKYGRVQVRFHWDRLDVQKGNNEGESCWIRVSQTGGLGNIILPRVGQEVLVDFINGDPDRPIVVGRVFNESHMPVYALPAGKTKAVWRTERYKEPAAYPGAEKLEIKQEPVNEIRLDDQGGKEEFFMYAQRDMNTWIEYDEKHHLGHDQSIKVGNDRTVYVKNNETNTVEENRKTTINLTDSLEIKNKLTTKVTAGDEERNISNNQTIEVGNEILIKAAKKLTLKVGESSITMDPTSITIKTVTLKMEGSLLAELKSALNTKVEGSAMLTLKGGMVMIN
ncbi:type VI secretion system Vgr family protein [Novosphingobium sp. Chol11]|uniref:type VI secretion system Vgr family protein n=1 Tax=Novosphingobium sp. Chol11 TaxID=1385763 RepID=UPI0025E36C02|nr:type VI secretion system tip protein TssI/VgrG [Novosphingobium sp. Chol11]